MSDQNIVGSYGAVDLSSTTHGDQSDVPGAATIDAALIEQVTEANIEERMALSQTVPVLLIFYSGRSLASQNAVEILEDATRSLEGAVALGEVDTDAQPALAAALGIQTLPTSLALVGGRPVPLFEGVPTAEQLNALLAELLQVAPQLGVTGRIAITEEQLEKPMPPAHVAPREAEEAEDWDTAVQLWKKVLANNPADQEATLALARAEFEARQAVQDAPDVLGTADRLFASGRESEAFDLLLEQVAASADAAAKEAARARLVDLFRLAVDASAVKRARTRLATLLMV